MNLALTNEALCKVLHHNVCCLIQAAYELGAGATFWADDKESGGANEMEMVGFVDDEIEAWGWI